MEPFPRSSDSTPTHYLQLFPEQLRFLIVHTDLTAKFLQQAVRFQQEQQQESRRKSENMAAGIRAWRLKEEKRMRKERQAQQQAELIRQRKAAQQRLAEIAKEIVGYEQNLRRICYDAVSDRAPYFYERWKAFFVKQLLAPEYKVTDIKHRDFNEKFTELSAQLKSALNEENAQRKLISRINRELMIENAETFLADSKSPNKQLCIETVLDRISKDREYPLTNEERQFINSIIIGDHILKNEKEITNKLNEVINLIKEIQNKTAGQTTEIVLKLIRSVRSYPITTENESLMELIEFPFKETNWQVQFIHQFVDICFDKNGSGLNLHWKIIRDCYQQVFNKLQERIESADKKAHSKQQRAEAFVGGKNKSVKTSHTVTEVTECFQQALSEIQHEESKQKPKKSPLSPRVELIDSTPEFLSFCAMLEAMRHLLPINFFAGNDAQGEWGLMRIFNEEEVKNEEKAPLTPLKDDLAEAEQLEKENSDSDESSDDEDIFGGALNSLPSRLSLQSFSEPTEPNPCLVAESPDPRLRENDKSKRRNDESKRHDFPSHHHSPTSPRHPHTSPRHSHEGGNPANPKAETDFTVISLTESEKIQPKISPEFFRQNLIIMLEAYIAFVASICFSFFHGYFGRRRAQKLLDALKSSSEQPAAAATEQENKFGLTTKQMQLLQNALKKSGNSAHSLSAFMLFALAASGYPIKNQPACINQLFSTMKNHYRSKNLSTDELQAMKDQISNRKNRAELHKKLKEQSSQIFGRSCYQQRKKFVSEVFSPTCTFPTVAQ